MSIWYKPYNNCVGLWTETSFMIIQEIDHRQFGYTVFAPRGEGWVYIGEF